MAGQRVVTASRPRSFHVMVKPIGPVCNLKCRYCFYLEKEKLFAADEPYRMSDEVLESYIRKYCQSQLGDTVQFAWQGGEPTLMGLDFFRKVVALQRMAAGGRPVRNALQTNGVLLDDEWGRFLAQEQFLVGLSLDGPAAIHNRYRVDKKGVGTFEQVMRGLACLMKHRVEFNTLTCVTRESPDEALEIYQFLKRSGVKFMQFIPIVERRSDGAAAELGLDLAVPPDVYDASASVAMMPWSVSGEGFGRFLMTVFDEWVQRDVGSVFVNLFDMALSAWLGEEPGLCVYSKRCGQSVAMEHDGSVYSCDHYVYPEYRLGNVMERSLEEMIYSPAQLNFGKEKERALPSECRACDYLFVCNGECPKHRFVQRTEGEPGLSYLCEGYKAFFEHIDPAMKKMAALVRSGKQAAEMMKAEA